MIMPPNSSAASGIGEPGNIAKLDSKPAALPNANSKVTLRTIDIMMQEIMIFVSHGNWNSLENDGVIDAAYAKLPTFNCVSNGN